MRALMWFRADLRTDDNRALSAACADADRGVVAVFVTCAKQWDEHEWADVKVEFLLRNLACLTQKLKRLNVPLLVRETTTFEQVPNELAIVARKHACDALYFNREYEVNEQRRDDAVTAMFEEDGRMVAAFDDQTIVPPNALRTQAGDFYKVFTPYKRAWVAEIDDVGGPSLAPSPRRQGEMVCAPDEIPEKLAHFDLSAGQPELWPAGERIALDWLGKFIDERVRSYKQDRDLPAVPGTSRLSPYLTLGVISPRRCLVEALEANHGRIDSGAAGPTTWMSELVWREFYRHVLVGFPRVSMNRAFKEDTESIPWRAAENDFEAWCAGRTGYPIVDAGMRALAATGWLHNRVRMIVAMFLTKDLLIDWRMGERHFMRHLVDGDLASNNGGWQWSASTGTDAAPYFRIFNPLSQSAKFDPDGEYIRAWVPELRAVEAAALHDLKKLPPERCAEIGYPPPIIDHQVGRERALEAFKARSTKQGA